MTTLDILAPDAEQIEALVAAAIENLPEVFRAPARAVVVRIADFAADALLRELECDSPYELTGLYDGVPLPEKSLSDQPLQPDVIWLYRRAILEEWIDRGDVALSDLVAHVYVHELAHHFGWSDADIAAIDRWWE